MIARARCETAGLSAIGETGAVIRPPCSLSDRFFGQLVQILPGLAGGNCLNSGRQRRLLILESGVRQIRRQRRMT